MLGACLPHMLLAMIRFFCLSVSLFACALCAGAASAQVSDADLVTRIGRLEATIRELTGNVEQLQYRNQQLEQQVQRLQAEAARGEESRSQPRPPATPAQRPAAQNMPPPPQYPPPAAQSLPPPAVAPAVVASQAPVAPPPSGNRRGDAFDPSANPNAPGAPRPLGTSTAATEPPPPVSDAPVPGARQIGSPLDLSTPGAAPSGELPPPPPNNPSSTGATLATLPPTNSPKDQYDLAYGYILHKDYALAADTFRGFLHQYPSDRLAPEAQYWLGESLFQQQQYRDAAESFLAVSTKYETTARAPEALLRLGQSLAALGEKEAACASLGEVLRKYPRATSSVKQAVEREQKRGHC
jgi:tol-pal system protein YbgF